VPDTNLQRPSTVSNTARRLLTFCSSRIYGDLTLATQWRDLGRISFSLVRPYWEDSRTAIMKSMAPRKFIKESEYEKFLEVHFGCGVVLCDAYAE
jgi:hypothetical protein